MEVFIDISEIESPVVEEHMVIDDLEYLLGIKKRHIIYTTIIYTTS